MFFNYLYHFKTILVNGWENFPQFLENFDIAVFRLFVWGGVEGE